MKFTKLFSVLLVGVLGVGTFVACSGGEASAEATTYVSLRVNPEIELIADKDQEVITATAVNEDGDILLSIVDLEGKTVEEATEIFAEAATDLGYLGENGSNDTIYVGVESTIDGEETQIKDKLNNKIRHYFNNNGINGKVSAETLDKYANKASEWGLSVGHTKLVMRVLDAHPELVDTDVVELSVKDLMALLKGKVKIASGLKDDYRADVKALNSEYSELFAFNKELKNLNKLLDKKTSEEEKAAIRDQIEEIEAQKQVLQAEYNERLDEINDYYVEKSEEVLAKCREEAQKKKNK